MRLDNVEITYFWKGKLDESDVESVARDRDAVFLMNCLTSTYLNCGQGWAHRVN